MAKKTINPDLEKKYAHRRSEPERKTVSRQGKNGRTSSGREGRNLGLLSLFFILLALVFIVGKLTLDGRFAASPTAAGIGELPTVIREEAPTLEGETPGQENRDSPVLTDKPIIADTPEEIKDSDSEEPGPIREEKEIREYQSRLFYLKINDEGQILLKSIIRTVEYETGLLGATMDTLFSGPSQDDLIKGYFSLIPSDSRINTLSIRDGIAWIDVNEEFTYNHLGFEGYQAQLKQIVYTATEFSSVRGVKITINGREEEFLSAEGIDISGILSRESF